MDLFWSITSSPYCIEKGKCRQEEEEHLKHVTQVSRSQIVFFPFICGGGKGFAHNEIYNRD